ncbi:MAG: hypothetical protein V9G19_27695 [Tetrasphaera sp.]
MVESSPGVASSVKLSIAAAVSSDAARARCRSALSGSVYRLLIATVRPRPSAVTGAPVRQALPDRRAERIPVVARVHHDVDEIRHVKRHLPRRVVPRNQRREGALHVALHWLRGGLATRATPG